MIDCGAQSSLVNIAVLISLNLTSRSANIKMSTCGSSSSNNIKGLISLNLQFNTMTGKSLSRTSMFLEANHTNDYPILICNSNQYIQANSKCIVEYKLKLPKSHALSSKKNPDTFKNKNFSVFIDDNSCDLQATAHYKLEPTLDSITKFCGKYYTTGIIANDTDKKFNPKNKTITCEIVSNASEKETTKSNFIKTFFHQSDNFTPTTKINSSIQNHKEDCQSGQSVEKNSTKPNINPTKLNIDENTSEVTDDFLPFFHTSEYCAPMTKITRLSIRTIN